MRLTTDLVAIGRWGLLALSMVLLTGHVCVLPTHGHVEAAPSHPNGDHSDDESMHAASCEALASAGKASHAVFTLSPSVASVPVEQPGRQARLADPRPVPTVSPPLFLLHAAFLI